ncbi:hypothetical protein GCM10027347_10340 [Larkinella harenae]
MMRTFESSKTDPNAKLPSAMKTSLKSLIVAFTLIAISFSVAQAEASQPIGRPEKVANFQSVMYLTIDGKVQVAINKELGASVVVKLKNSAGTNYFVQQVGKRQSSVRLRMDVSSLPDGVYQVEISNGLEKISRGLTLLTQKPTESPRLIAFN